MRGWFFLLLMGFLPGLAQGLPVAATTPILADLVREVGGERVRLAQVVPMGADPHSFEPRPSTLRALSGARVLFANGLGLETFLPKLQAGLPPGARTVLLAEGAPDLICFSEAELRAERARGLEVHRHGPCDPHLWLEPTYARLYVERIEATLAGLDPRGRAYYAQRRADFLRRLAAVDQEVRACLEAVPPAQRRLVVQHDAFRYAARYYGFSVVGSLASFAGQQRGPRALEELARQMRQLGVRVIAAEPQFAPREARALAEATGARVVTLFSDTLTREVPTYLALLRHNGRALCEAFRG
ncbi:zinc ABC transporter substrate-binding protein [Meiothermus sp. QL-1]|uniref:metal ABC transporter substrate-binding protein n=1 Tax=Meiothermus sp. QL-1 TaxID=2058095 RepID=UPI000E0B55D9|nr:metal ABC transporter substrate-binding protein [Meiothermus sp. QL-1]RDI96562.1 zinc ABC transporter substrate-binding protein [Meiothermus sp. QL-1]